MNANAKASKKAGFLTRLRRDQSGNVIALLAAAIVPTIGIIGGTVDMARIYLARTTLQAACDAGALMGRRTMATGTWDANSGRANTRAQQMFDTNFANGAFGTTNLTRSFSEEDGTVTGEATVKVPMTLMRVFGVGTNDVEVSCTAEMRIPASDIMFVLDTTGSMNCPDDGGSCPSGNNNGVEATNAKIRGLRVAASCFYEALAKKNISAISAAQCNETTDPVGATSDVRLRFGFVPYSVNVNVGRLLPHRFLANQWTYQSRERVMESQTDPNAWDPNFGAEGPYVQTNSQNTPAADTGWVDLTSNYVYLGNPYSFNYQRPNSNTACVAAPPQHSPAPTVGNYVYVGQTPSPLVYPASSLTKTYYRDTATRTFQFQYVAYQTGSGSNRRFWCRLQRRSVSQNTNRVTFTTATNVTWTFSPSFLRWQYKPTTFNVSGLKSATPDQWNSSLTLPIGDSGTNQTINWRGCIEERQTARVTDSDPSNDWNPIPSTALDMDVELEPDQSNAATLWGPMLGDVIYTREKHNGWGWDYTTDTFETTSNQVDSGSYWHNFNGSNYDMDQIGESCPTQARLYDEMDGAEFWNYMSSLQTGGNTYHDIGLLWGARLMAPNGIFRNVTSDADTWVERHMVFMTDGDTSVSNSNYAAHGVHWWDRRQNDGASAPTSSWLEANVDARTQALCKWVRDENITLWVVAFGQGISNDTKANLQACATPGRYFEASNTAGLVAKFKEIATTISALRLTQ